MKLLQSQDFKIYYVELQQWDPKFKRQIVIAFLTITNSPVSGQFNL